jgi:hypothetical protein
MKRRAQSIVADHLKAHPSDEIKLKSTTLACYDVVMKTYYHLAMRTQKRQRLDEAAKELQAKRGRVSAQFKNTQQQRQDALKDERRGGRLSADDQAKAVFNQSLNYSYIFHSFIYSFIQSFIHVENHTG